MKLKNIDLVANKLVKAFLTNKLISPIPIRYTKKINQAEKLKRLCETKIDKPIIGFKAGGTGASTDRSSSITGAWPTHR